MLAKFLKKLKFLLTSTDQHGVHSPFVFNYLTKCLYQKKNPSKSKTSDVLMKSISYFEFKNCEIIGNEGFGKVVSQKFPEVQYGQFPIDLIYNENLHPDILSELFSKEKIHNESMLLINSIHKNNTTENHWNQIIQDKRATVALDLFYCGVIFFRKEQVKEHFKIRI